MKKINLISIWICFVSVLLLLCHVIDDFREYQSLLEGDYKTPWYSPNWLKEPYTNFRLSQHPATYDVRTNYAGNQLWIVKTIKVADKEFWTIDYRYDLILKQPVDTH